MSDLERGIASAEVVAYIQATEAENLSRKDISRSPQAPLLSDGAAMEAVLTDPYSKDLPITDAEKIVGAMHFRNIQYSRSKIIKHRLILRLGISSNFTVAQHFRKLCTLDRLDQIRDDLAHYTTAVRDYDYWKQTYKATAHEQLTGDLDVAHQILLEFPQDDTKETGNYVQKGIVAQYEHITRPTHPKNVLSRFFGRFHKSPVPNPDVSPSYMLSDDTAAHAQDVDFAKDEARKGLFLSRLFFALFGGLALVAPMLIMTLHPTKLTSLLTTSLFIIAVAVILAWVMEDAQNKDSVAATAAYAAVLVVFVGTAMTPGA